MEILKKYWILILILATVIYLVYNYLKKAKNNKNIDNNSFKTPIVSQIKNYVFPKKEENQNLPEKIEDAKNYDYTSFRANDKLYAGDDGAVTYKAPLITSSNILRNYNRNDYLGTFVSYENGFIKIMTNENNVINFRFVTIYNKRAYKK